MNGEVPETPARGRPARWTDKAERQRLLDELLDAARQARWRDPELHRVTQEGEDAEVMQALTQHYRRQHWCRVRQAGPEEGGPLPTP